MIQKYIEQAKEVIGNVKATEENYTFEESRAEDIDFYSESFWSLVTLIEKAYGEMPIPTWNQIHFYNTAFHELVKVIEDDLGEKLCN